MNWYVYGLGYFDKQQNKSWERLYQPWSELHGIEWLKPQGFVTMQQFAFFTLKVATTDSLVCQT